MTNKEFYKEQILDIACNGERIAVNKNTNELCMCHSMSCKDCLFNKGKGCIEMAKEWCNAEYVEPCPFKEGELVEVSNDKEYWELRYFSHIDSSLEYKYFTYCNQMKTSYNTVYWKYCQKYGTLGGIVEE